MSFWSLFSSADEKPPKAKPKTMLETITDVAEDLEKQNAALKAEVATLKAALGGDFSLAENAEIQRLTAALADAYRRLNAAKLCVNAFHDAIEDLARELSFSCNYTHKAYDQWRVAVIAPKHNMPRVIAEFAKHGLHQVGDLAPAGDYMAGMFQTAQWRD